MMRTTMLALAVLTTTGLLCPAALRAEPTAAERARDTGPAPEAAAGRPAADDQAAREKWFANLLTEAVMVGKYSVEGKDAPAREDRYTILKAVKGEGDTWVITAKVEYKGFGVPVDISVPVRWAGDTPVIQLTNQKIPGLGTFTARVMFYGTHYAGTWDAGDHGGLMWGRIERAGKDAKGAAGGNAPGEKTDQ